MNQTDVKVSFYLKKSEADAKGNCPVMARLIIGRYSETAFSLKLRVPQSLWSSGRACGKSVAAREINSKLDDLTTFINYELTHLGVDVYTQPENAYGVLAFNISGMHSNEVADILNEKYDICVRGGYHCAPLKHTALGTLETGAIRVSLSYFNTFSEIQRLIYAVKHICKNK